MYKGACAYLNAQRRSGQLPARPLLSGLPAHRRHLPKAPRCRGAH